MTNVARNPFEKTAMVRLRRLETFAEHAYDRMYNAGNPNGATALYSDAKEALDEAIGLAKRLGKARPQRG